MDEQGEDAEDPYKEAVRTLRHDARNLLNGIAIIGEHFRGKDDPKADRFVAYLEEKVQAMVRLGERAETYASLQSGRAEAVDLASLLDELMAGRKPDETRPELDLAAGRLRCDSALTKLGLAEVLDNALRTGAEVTVSSRAVGEGIEIAVTDHGPGLPEPAMANLFTPYRGAKRAGGTSLGLPLAQRAFELQGGRLDVRVPPSGEGTEVVCFLPDAQPR